MPPVRSRCAWPRQRLADGRTEFALQEREADGSWGARRLPTRRMFHTWQGADVTSAGCSSSSTDRRGAVRRHVGRCADHGDRSACGGAYGSPTTAWSSRCRSARRTGTWGARTAADASHVPGRGRCRSLVVELGADGRRGRARSPPVSPESCVLAEGTSTLVIVRDSPGSDHYGRRRHRVLHRRRRVGHRGARRGRRRLDPAANRHARPRGDRHRPRRPTLTSPSCAPRARA